MSFKFDSPVVDTHVHFWDLQKFSYQWPNSDVPALYRNFLPKDYVDTVRDTPVKNAIFVQVLNTQIEENDWVLDLAKRHRWLVGIVGWVDLTSPDVEDVIQRYARSDHFLGVRHVTELESDPDWLGLDDVHRGLAVLEKYNLTFDLLMRPHNMHHAAKLAAKFPNLTFVIDHLAKPRIKEREIDDWRQKLTEAASYPNVFCKLSGLVTEDDLANWRAENFKPYIQHCVKVFGARRCMFGSDFPVFSMSTMKYKDVMDSIFECLKDCTTSQEREDIFCHNAVRIYKIKVPLNQTDLSSSDSNQVTEP